MCAHVGFRHAVLRPAIADCWSPVAPSRCSVTAIDGVLDESTIEFGPKRRRCGLYHPSQAAMATAGRF